MRDLMFDGVQDNDVDVDEEGGPGGGGRNGAGRARVTQGGRRSNGVAGTGQEGEGEEGSVKRRKGKMMKDVAAAAGGELQGTL